MQQEPNVRLIGVSGAHGVGKSTVISEIESIFGGEVAIVREVARGVISQGFRLGKHADVDGYVCLVAEYLNAKRRAIARGKPVVVFDRTIVDTLSYAMVNLDHGTRVQRHVVQLLDAVWSDERAAFAEYFFIPIEFPDLRIGDANGDGHDEAYRSQVSDRILANLELSGVRYTSLTGSKEVRVGAMSAKIESLLDPYIDKP